MATSEHLVFGHRAPALLEHLLLVEAAPAVLVRERPVVLVAADPVTVEHRVAGEVPAAGTAVRDRRIAGGELMTAHLREGRTFSRCSAMRTTPAPSSHGRRRRAGCGETSDPPSPTSATRGCRSCA